jgi:hypothetical protein
MEPTPEAILREFNRRMQAGHFPAWTEVRRDDGKFWAGLDALTADECEHLEQKHEMRAFRALERYDLTASNQTAKTAANNMFLANLYAERRFELLESEFTTADLPFPYLCVVGAA